MSYSQVHEMLPADCATSAQVYQSLEYLRSAGLVIRSFGMTSDDGISYHLYGTGEILCQELFS
jgi:predicted transcriptional regulator